MAEDGIVGPYNGSQARDILLSLEQWQQMSGEAEAESDSSPSKPPRNSRILMETGGRSSGPGEVRTVKPVDETKDDGQPIGDETEATPADDAQDEQHDEDELESKESEEDDEQFEEDDFDDDTDDDAEDEVEEDHEKEDSVPWEEDEAAEEDESELERGRRRGPGPAPARSAGGPRARKRCSTELPLRARRAACGFAGTIDSQWLLSYFFFDGSLIVRPATMNTPLPR